MYRELLTSTLIMPSSVAQALSMIQSILLSLGQSINHNNDLYISNYYISSNQTDLDLCFVVKNVVKLICIC